jgi:hypothetical protein
VLFLKFAVQAFTLHAASALAAVSFLRSICGFGFPLFAVRVSLPAFLHDPPFTASSAANVREIGIWVGYDHLPCRYFTRLKSVHDAGNTTLAFFAILIGCPAVRRTHTGEIDTDDGK